MVIIMETFLLSFVHDTFLIVNTRETFLPKFIEEVMENLENNVIVMSVASSVLLTIVCCCEMVNGIILNRYYLNFYILYLQS